MNDGKLDGFHAPVERRRIVRGLAWSLGALALAPVLPGLVRVAAAAAPTEADKRDLARIEDYFNGISTLQARFLQLSPNGRTAEGNLYISRPGRLRFEYDPPVPYLLISDGSQVIFYDKELDTPTYVSLSSTPLEFLLGPTVKLSGVVTVTDVERRPGIIRISLVQTSSPKDGKVIITFTERPIEVKKWALVDAKGTTVEVAIFDPRLGMKLDPKLFMFENKKIIDQKNRQSN
jgi:outer membrane lipoprotein-sorting protein